MNETALSREPEGVGKMGRRLWLQGMGATLGLPWLTSLAHAVGGREAMRVAGPPRRWVMLLFANGVNAAEWWVRGEGAAMEFSKSLLPLRRHRERLLFLENLHLFDDTVGVHTPYWTNFLSGEKVRQGAVPMVAESLDNYLGRTVGRSTPLPNLVLGTEPSRGIGSTITWSSRTTPVAPEVFPRRVFDRLFDVTGLLRDRSVLDFGAEQARRLQRRLDGVDREKLDGYLTAVREIEQRMTLATSEERFEGWRPGRLDPGMERPPEGRPQDVRAHMEMMLDLLVLALQTDRTRVVTLVFQSDVTGMRFDFLDGVGGAGMHTISHHRRHGPTLEEYQRINQFHVEMLARLLDRLGAVEEGDGKTLLDNTMVQFGSTMRDGDVHDANDVPLIVAGGSACDIRTGGRTVRYEHLDDRRLCNLHLALAQRMGVRGEEGKLIETFGNSHYPLPGLG